MRARYVRCVPPPTRTTSCRAVRPNPTTTSKRSRATARGASHREREESRDAPAAHDRHPVHVDARQRRVGARDEDVHVVTARGEPGRHAPEVRLRPAAGEAAMHERDPHPRRSRSASQSARR